ncbi:MAG: hypothetical protein FWD40_11950 [Treponema sp.]|nr:hypothetical protein [Treponema sp.]
MKNISRKILRFLTVKKRKNLRENLPLCYSASGFLTDLLEQNGFYVRKLECYNGHSFYLDVELHANIELFKERLKKINRAIAYKFERRNLDV